MNGGSNNKNLCGHCRDPARLAVVKCVQCSTEASNGSVIPKRLCLLCNYVLHLPFLWTGLPQHETELVNKICRTCQNRRPDFYCSLCYTVLCDQCMCTTCALNSPKQPPPSTDDSKVEEDEEDVKKISIIHDIHLPASIVGANVTCCRSPSPFYPSMMMIPHPGGGNNGGAISTPSSPLVPVSFVMYPSSGSVASSVSVPVQVQSPSLFQPPTAVAATTADSAPTLVVAPTAATEEPPAKKAATVEQKRGTEEEEKVSAVVTSPSPLVVVGGSSEKKSVCMYFNNYYESCVQGDRCTKRHICSLCHGAKHPAYECPELLYDKFPDKAETDRPCDNKFFCKFGLDCRYYHTYTERLAFVWSKDQKGERLYRTAMCKFGTNCRYRQTNCNYAHTPEEAICMICHQPGHVGGDGCHRLLALRSLHA